MLDTLVQDTRYALRLLGRSPGFTAVAVLSLATGIGANTAIFSLANALLVRPLPGLSDAGHLVDIGRTQSGRGFDTTNYPNYLDVRARTTTLSSVYAYRIEPMPMSLGGPDGAERVYGLMVTGNYFNVLGTHAQIGRVFTDADDTPGRNGVTVISDQLWRTRFGADPTILGRVVTITNKPYTVIGVAPRGFQGTTILQSDLWLPLSNHPTGEAGNMFTSRAVSWLMMGGRLKPGATVKQADAELHAIGAALEREYPKDNEGRGFAVAASSIFPGRISIISGFLAILMALVALILMIACVNLAGMLLARAAGRRREVAVRLAIGAGRGRLVRQMLTEAVVLFSGGCVAGLLLSRWLEAALLSVLPELPLPIGVTIATDWRVLTFTIVLSLVAALLCGIAPALQASRPDLVPSLKAQGLDGSPARLRLRSAFLVSQVTLALLLVIAGGLFLRALERAVHIPPGFDQTNVEVVSLDLSLAGVKDAAGISFADDLLARVRALPGVANAALSVDLPLDGGRMSFGDIRLPGAPRQTGRRNSAPIDWNLISHGYFDTMKVQLIRGRDFTEADGGRAPKVAIVNEALARRLFGADDPIGRTFLVDTPLSQGSDTYTVVGLAADAHVVDLTGPVDPYVYVPFAQEYHPRVSLIVKTTGVSAIPQVRALVHQMQPALPVTSAMPLSDVTAIGLVPQRLAATLAGALGLVGLLLAAIGIYGVTSYAVSRRTKEIGVRIALGADRRAVLRLVLRQGIVLAGAGVAIGLALGAVASQLLRSLLLGVSAVDPVTFVGAAALFAAVALAATYVPARRAARVDPMVALRAE
ncbi:MAG TPA: ABC transporter permease [Vicinamibacterales bacterium]|nr:ABC transporter permease [Vicinamibacterales bacterium]